MPTEVSEAPEVTDLESRDLTEQELAFFDLFVKYVSAAAGDDGVAPLQMAEAPDGITVNWDEERADMVFMSLISHDGLTLFMNELLRRSIAREDSFSVEKEPITEETE